MAGQRLIGENSGMIYRIGDAVKIRVEAVSLEQRQVDFALVASERTPRRVGKTAKDKEKKGTRYIESMDKQRSKKKSAVKKDAVLTHKKSAKKKQSTRKRK